MQDLQEVTHEVHYENFRSEKLGSNNHSRLYKYFFDLKETKYFIQFLSYRDNKDMDDLNIDNIMSLDKDKILKEKEEELRRMQEMVAKMQAQMMQAQLGEQNKAVVN